MPDDRKPDRIRGKTITLTWNEGPTKGESHEHVFHTDGSVEYRKLGGDGKFTREKQYGAVKVTDDATSSRTWGHPATRSRWCSTSPTTAWRVSRPEPRTGSR